MTGQKSGKSFVTVKLRNYGKTRTTFTPEDRLSLIKDAEREGFTETLPEVQCFGSRAVSLNESIPAERV